MEMGRWNGHVFTVSPKLIRGFTGLSIKGSSETEDSEGGSQQYIIRKAGKPVEINLTVGLSALTGCKVCDEAMAFINDARAGEHGYFYISGKKLMNCQLMLTSASVDKVTLMPNGAWLSAEVKLTMQQCGGNDGGFGGSGGAVSHSGGGGSGRRRTVKPLVKEMEKRIKKGIIKYGIGARYSVKAVAEHRKLKDIVSKADQYITQQKNKGKALTAKVKANKAAKAKKTTVVKLGR